MKAPSILIIDDEPLMRLSMLDALKENDDVLCMAAADHLGRIAATDASSS